MVCGFFLLYRFDARRKDIMMTDYDSPWKEALDRYFRLFVTFFFPELAAAIDWAWDWESLDTELQELRPAGDVGKRRADKLVKIRRRDNGGEPALIHLEVQCQEERDFERRVHTYNYRIEDRYNEPVVSVVVLGDDNSSWRPSAYVFERWGCRRELRFLTVKLLDFVGRETELETHENLFALLVLTHLQSLATRADAEARRQWKVRLIKGLYPRGLDAEEVRHWYRYFDWLLPLPEEFEEQVRMEITQFEEEQRVPFVTFAERHGMEIGMAQGMREGLLQGIEAVLEVKYGPDEFALLPQIRALTNADHLKLILDKLKTGTTADDLKQLLSS